MVRVVANMPTVVSLDHDCGCVVIGGDDANRDTREKLTNDIAMTQGVERDLISIQVSSFCGSGE